MSLAGRPARDHLALALDVDELDGALALARRLRPWFAVAKVGLELFSAAGPRAVALLADEGFDVFVDVKLHDIPTTVGRAARVLGRAGARYVTVHLSGGAAMVAAAVSGLAEGAASPGREAAEPAALGVTVLTSDPEADPERVAALASLAASAGCGGVVCAGSDLEVVGRAAPGLRRVVPGIRPAGGASDDQARVATPGSAIVAGADLLVVGRAVTAAPDPVTAAVAVHDEVARSLASAPSPP